MQPARHIMGALSKHVKFSNRGKNCLFEVKRSKAGRGGAASKWPPVKATSGGGNKGSAWSARRLTGSPVKMRRVTSTYVLDGDTLMPGTIQCILGLSIIHVGCKLSKSNNAQMCNAECMALHLVVL